MEKSYFDLVKENAELKRELKRMRYQSLKNSIEFERLKKLCGEAIVEVDSVIMKTN